MSSPGSDLLPAHRFESGAHPVAVEEVPPVDVGTDEVVLDIVLGPRTGWFTAEAIESLSKQTFTVSAKSNRVGLRLEGRALDRTVQGELPSEGTVAGALQVPPDGQIVLFLADHPLTGGYPVIGAVVRHHLPLAGQLPPGTRIRFNPLDEFAEYHEERP